MPETMTVTLEEFSPTHDFFDYRGFGGARPRADKARRSMLRVVAISEMNVAVHSRE